MSKQQREYLDAMGVQAWRLRLSPPHGPQIFTASSESTEENLPSAESLASAEQSQPVFPATQLFTPPHFDLASMGEGVNSTVSPSLISPASPPPDWEALQAQVKACTACPLHQTRSQTVFGVGNPQADWLVIGEAPGEQEDLQGEPFVGPAGLLLNEMLRAIGLAREAVYIANILKCRPPRNRDPQPLEVAACEGFLKSQIAHLQPKIILAVGRIAAQNLLKTTTPIGKLRGRRHDYLGVPLVVTYHPAYLLRSPTEKRSAYADLRLARQTYRQLYGVS